MGQEDHTTDATGAWLRELAVGIALGLIVGTLGMVLLIPLGQPDAAEIPFALGIVIDLVAILVAIAAWRERPRIAGLSLGIIGGWGIFWFLLVQLPPFTTM